MALRRRVLLSALIVTGTAAALAAAPPTQAAPAPAASKPQRVIVVLRDQHANLPATAQHAKARVAATSDDQSRLVADARAHGATSLRQLHVINAVAMRASSTELTRLRNNNAVAAIYPDRTIAAPKLQRATAKATTTGPVSNATCPSNPRKPLLEPQALQVTHTAYQNPASWSAQRVVTGAGVKVAFLADGLDVDNPDFIRANGSHVFTDYKDFSGDGPLAPTSAAEAFGDASSIAAQGRQVYDLSDFVSAAHPLPAGCTIRVLGMSPGASLVGLKVFPAGGFAFNSAILAALDYAVTTDHVNIVNESFGSNQYPDTNDDPTALFNEELVKAGVTVVASSGDAASENTIGSPASDPSVISVGATTTFRLYKQTTANGIQLSNGNYASNNISALSSSGTTQGAHNIDLVAPGDLGWALCSPNPDIWQACTDDDGDPTGLLTFGGSSESAPLVAGAAALVIQAYRQTHAGASPTPYLIKRLLTGTASDLGMPADQQGAGLLDSLRAVNAARSISGSTIARVGNGVTLSPTQIAVSAASGVSTSRTVRVTNNGSSTKSFAPRLFAETHVLRRNDFSVTLSPNTDPTFSDEFGTDRSYVKKTFTVPSGANRLNAAIAWPDPTKLVRIVLLDPHGTYSAFSLPQGTGTFASVDVRNPEAGRWTAILFTIAGANGFQGTTDLTTTSYKRSTVGSVTPSRFALRPGASQLLHLTIPAGDAADVVNGLQLGSQSLQLGGVVPVVVRSLVATDASGGTFSGSFSGGNGRGGIPSPSRTYAFQVPAGRPDLAVNVALRGNPNQALYGFLIDPNGEPVNEVTNQELDADGNVVGYRPAIQFDHRAPQAGRWRLVFTVFGPVAGTSTSTPYSGEVSYGVADVSATGVPSSDTTVLPAGQTVTATVHVRNAGAGTLNYVADARTAGHVLITLAGRSASNYPLAPAPLPPFPAFTVPTETNQFNVDATSDRPINFEASPFPLDHVTDLAFEGDPDREAGPAGLHPQLTIDDPIVAPQTWVILPSQIGPFDDTAPTAHATVTANAYTLPFDRAVTSSTGDPQLIAVQATAPTTPLTLDPGSSGTITVRITPQGTAGQVVHGTLYVNTYDPVTGSSDEVASVPYTYTVG